MANIWLSKVRNDPHLQRTEAQTAITTVHNLALDIITPSNAAETISTAYVPAVQTEHISLWSLWETIISAIETLGSDTDVLRRLALMLMHLSTIQAVTENGNMLESQGGQKVWQELPDFSFQFWEVGIQQVDIEHIEISRFGATVENAARELMNTSTFAAILLRELDPNGPENVFSGMRQIAREHFLYTLELPFDTPDRVRRVETYIPPAAAWITIAGPNLYSYCKLNSDYTGEDVEPWWLLGDKYGGLVMWDKRDGFSIERWAFWKLRLQEFSTSQYASDGAKAEAARTAGKMDAIEEADGR